MAFVTWILWLLPWLRWLGPPRALSSHLALNCFSLLHLRGKKLSFTRLRQPDLRVDKEGFEKVLRHTVVPCQWYGSTRPTAQSSLGPQHHLCVMVIMQQNSENLKFRKFRGRKFGLRKFGFYKLLREKTGFQQIFRQDLLYLVVELLLQDFVLLEGRSRVELREKQSRKKLQCDSAGWS